MTEIPLVVQRDGNRGAARIEGWADGLSRAVITWKGLDAEGKNGPFTSVHTDSIEALLTLSWISHFVNMELVSATMITAEAPPAWTPGSAYGNCPYKKGDLVTWHDGFVPFGVTLVLEHNGYVNIRSVPGAPVEEYLQVPPVQLAPYDDERRARYEASREAAE